jgi:hypothetical protein
MPNPLGMELAIAANCDASPPRKIHLHPTPICVKTFLSAAVRTSMPAIISPYPMRSTISEESGTLRISVPMRKRPFLFLFFLVWLGGWTAGGIAVGRQLLQKFNAFDAFWMCGWLAGEVAVTYSLLRMAGGRDDVRGGQGLFEVRKQIFGLGLSKQYSLSEMRDLRYRPESGSGRGHHDSCLAFDYGAKTITFADGIDEAEANQLIQAVVERYPVLGTAASDVATPRFRQSS